MLTDAAMHYNALKKTKDQISEGMHQWYMETMYSIRLIPPGLYTALQAKNLPNVILNALVDTLNIKAKVPHTLIIVINDYKFWNDAELLTYQMDRILYRFIKEIKRIAEARNTSLPPRAVNWEYPRLFITRALPLPNNMTKPYPKGFKPNRRRYNRLLQKGAEQNLFRTINFPEFTCDNENKLFKPDGSISYQGYTQFWITISDAVHKADNQDRINFNKMRAKQLSAQISLTKGDIHSSNEEDLSDIEILPEEQKDQQSGKLKQGTKRALLDDFDACKEKKIITTKYTDSSPDSTITEYYTSHKSTGQAGYNAQNHHKFHGKGKGKADININPGHHKYSGHRGKRKLSHKNNWRLQRNNFN